MAKRLLPLRTLIVVLSVIPGCTADQNASHFPASKVSELRRQAAKGPEVPYPDRWSKSKVDLGRLLSVFEPLRLKKGYVLRAYHWWDGRNGNGFVWAMPAHAEFPEPEDCPKVKAEEFFAPKLKWVVREAPKPPAALDNAMEAVDGDGSPWSYLAASLLWRELCEFGAGWHGCDWSTHTILGENSLKKTDDASDHSPIERSRRKPEQWQWLERRPKEWNPRVQVDEDRVTVTFYSCSGLGRDTIYRHTDTFKRGTYRFKTERKEIALGPGGYKF